MAETLDIFLTVFLVVALFAFGLGRELFDSAFWEGIWEGIAGLIGMGLLGLTIYQLFQGTWFTFFFCLGLLVLFIFAYGFLCYVATSIYEKFFEEKEED